MLQEKTRWSGLDGCFPLNTFHCSFFRGSVDFVTLSTGWQRQPRLQPVKMLTAARRRAQLARKTVRRTAQNLLLHRLEATHRRKTDSRRRERKSRRRGRPREMRDTLLLPAGAAYEAGELPFKKCDASHYITIRTDTPDSKLPPEAHAFLPLGLASRAFRRPAFAQPPEALPSSCQRFW